MGKSSTSYKQGESGNKAGRSPGSKNKISENVKSAIDSILDDNAAKFRTELAGLKGTNFCKIYIELLPYVAAKMKAIDLNIIYEDMSESDLDRVITGLKNKLL